MEPIREKWGTRRTHEGEVMLNHNTQAAQIQFYFSYDPINTKIIYEDRNKNKNSEQYLVQISTNL